MSDDERTCSFCGNEHVDGRCKSCREEVCDECLDERGLCPNCRPADEKGKEPTHV